MHDLSGIVVHDRLCVAFALLGDGEGRVLSRTGCKTVFLSDPRCDNSFTEECVFILLVETIETSQFELGNLRVRPIRSEESSGGS
jgi:hypothetical protein